MDFLKSVSFRAIVVSAVFSALLPTVRSVEPFQNDEGLGLLTVPGFSLNTTMSTLTNDSSSVNALLSDENVQCYVQPFVTHRQYRPVVLEDCFPIFATIFLSPDSMKPITYTPGQRVYRRQNGNCIFTMLPGVGAVPQPFREVHLGVYLARVLSQCVRAVTGYLGGERKMSMQSQPSEWVVSVVAARPEED